MTWTCITLWLLGAVQMWGNVDRNHRRDHPAISICVCAIWPGCVLAVLVAVSGYRLLSAMGFDMSSVAKSVKS